MDASLPLREPAARHGVSCGSPSPPTYCVATSTKGEKWPGGRYPGPNELRVSLFATLCQTDARKREQDLPIPVALSALECWGTSVLTRFVQQNSERELFSHKTPIEKPVW